MPRQLQPTHEAKPKQKYFCLGFASWAGWAALGWAGYEAKPKQKYFCLGFASWAGWAALGWAGYEAKPKQKYFCLGFASWVGATGGTARGVNIFV